MYTFNGYLLLNVYIQHLGHWMYTFNTWAIESIHSTVIYTQYNIYNNDIVIVMGLNIKECEESVVYKLQNSTFRDEL